MAGDHLRNNWWNPWGPQPAYTPIEPTPEWKPAQPKTDIDIAPAYRTLANLWEARYWKLRVETAKANRAIYRLSQQNKRLRKRLASHVEGSRDE